MSDIMHERVYYEIVPSVMGLFGWKFVQFMEGDFMVPGWWEVKARFRTKEEAVYCAVDYCSHNQKQYKQNSELTIKSRLGRIQDKRTYGADPKRSKG